VRKSETGFLREYSFIVLNLGKNPVSWVRVRKSETGFLREYSFIVLNLGKNPVSWVCVTT
ncbi:MAG: hypothetical protein WCD53_05660, partial [Microcoleus sp.]